MITPTIPRILLVAPPCIKLYPHGRRFISKQPPLGLAYLASFLESKGIPVQIYDSFAEDASMKDIGIRIRHSDASIVGITATTATLTEAVQIAGLAKDCGKMTLLGGVHISALPEGTLQRYGCFDFGIAGEGEAALYEFLTGVDVLSIPGLVYRNGAKVFFNAKREPVKDISCLPHPGRHLLDNKLYRPGFNDFLPGKDFYTLLTSRGCPSLCIFCASKVIWGNRVRARSLEDIFQELDELRVLGIKGLRIIDDTFTLQEARVRRIAEKIKAMDILWGCNARVDSVNPDLLRFMKACNCVAIEYGIESGNQAILDTMKKGITLSQIRQAVRATKEAGIKVSCSFIIGCFGETLATGRETIRFAKEIDPDYAQFCMFVPYPGTAAYAYGGEQFQQLDFEKYVNPKYSAPVLCLPGMSAAQLKALFRKSYLSFYGRPKYLFRLMSAFLRGIFVQAQRTR